MMYDDDELMAAAFGLLDNIYGQRTSLLRALKEVELLERPLLPVFGDVHVLVTQITELVRDRELEREGRNIKSKHKNQNHIKSRTREREICGCLSCLYKLFSFKCIHRPEYILQYRTIHSPVFHTSVQ
jgi:hypothetical protein